MRMLTNTNNIHKAQMDHVADMLPWRKNVQEETSKFYKTDRWTTVNSWTPTECHKVKVVPANSLMRQITTKSDEDWKKN